MGGPSTSAISNSVTTKQEAIALFRVINRYFGNLPPMPGVFPDYPAPVINSFAEYALEPNPETKKKDVVWFALNDDRPLCAFAGIWTEFKGDRGTKSKPIPGPHLVYGLLTTSPNAVVEPIHPKAMPVILSTERRLDARSVGRS